MVPMCDCGQRTYWKDRSKSFLIAARQARLFLFIVRPFSAIQLDTLSKSPSKADPTAPGFFV